MLLIALCIGIGVLAAPKIFADGDRKAGGGLGFALGSFIFLGTLIFSPKSSECLTQSHGVVGYLVFNSFKACPTAK